LSLLALVIGTLVALGVSFSGQMITLLAPGFSGDVRDLTVNLVAIMFPGMGLLVLSAWCLGVLNSHRRFFLSYVAPVFWNIAMIATLVVFGHRSIGSSRDGQMQLVVYIAWGTVAGAALQLLAQLPWAMRLNEGLRPSLDVSLAPVRNVIRNFFPALLSRGVVQLSAYIDQMLASFLGPQAVAAMAYAQTLSILPVSLFGMSISSAELTEMSRSIGSEEEIAAAVKRRLVLGLQRISFFIIPCSVAFVVLGGVLAATLFQTGKFGGSDSLLVWAILIGSTVGLLATTQSRLCVSAFWALNDTRTPAGFAVLRVTLTAILGYIATFPLREAFGWPPAYSVAGLTASAGVAGWIEFLLIRHALGRKLGRFHVGVGPLARYWAGAVVAGGIAFALDRALPPSHPFIFGVVVLTLYGAIYLGATLALGAPEAAEMIAMVRRQLRV
jgi:putative peptidoglycan lipid II flippase